MQELAIRKRIRLKEYNYSDNGYYFVTICSMDGKNIFGEYNNVGAGLASARPPIKLTKIGQIIDRQWNDMPNQSDNIGLDQYVIMPNHIHGILIIDKREDAMSWADARPAPTLSDIICSFKSKCTVEYINYIKQNKLNISGQIWQRSFYDHIIRNEKSLEEIREYIISNPAAWAEDNA